MRHIPHLFALALLLAPSLTFGQPVPHVSTDTLWIDSIATHSGQKAVLGIYFSNADTINGMDVPLKHSDPAVIIDSVSFVGSRIENRFLTVVEIDTVGAVCHIGAFYFDVGQEEVGPGRGLLARLFLTIPNDFLTELVTFDTTFIVTGLTFVTKDNISYVPVFRKGHVNNTYAPTLDDSVWVDSAHVVAGESFGVAVNASNQQPLYNIRLPLEYASDNVVFDSMTLAGTRSTGAILSNVYADNVAKKMLVSLGFRVDALLPPGSGSIAMLYFTCLESGSTTSVSVDTTTGILSNYYVQLGPLFDFVRTYPRYLPGIITIEPSTAVVDDDFQAGLPADYCIEQNAPNPFNPTTSISFALPERAQVVLEVYNILGERVRTLVNQSLPAGYHSVTFDGASDNAEKLASGIYLYVMRAGAFAQSRKMLLMK